jgi:2-iminobutanoate/2-iminopropanoate deaminase
MTQGPRFWMIPHAPTPVAPFSHASESDGWVFVTGQMPTSPTDDDAPLPEGVIAQTQRVMENLKIVLDGLGLGLQHVLVSRIFLTEFKRDYAAMNDTYRAYFPPDALPARTCVGVTGLARDALVEIDFIAKRPAYSGPRRTERAVPGTAAQSEVIRHANLHDRIETQTVGGVLQRLLLGIDVSLPRLGDDIRRHVEVHMRTAIGHTGIDEHREALGGQRRMTEADTEIRPHRRERRLGVDTFAERRVRHTVERIGARRAGRIRTDVVAADQHARREAKRHDRRRREEVAIEAAMRERGRAVVMQIARIEAMRKAEAVEFRANVGKRAEAMTVANAETFGTDLPIHFVCRRERPVQRSKTCKYSNNQAFHLTIPVVRFW